MDVTHGLALMLGRTERYLGILKRFLKAQPEQLQALSQSLVSGDLATGRRIAHTLKGAAGTLGANRLSRLAADMETRLRELPPAAQDLRDWDLDALNQQLTDIAAALEPWGEENRKPGQQADSAETVAAITRLVDLLANSDTAAIALYEQHAAGFRQELGEGAETLGRQILAFEFEAARQTLQRLR